MAEAAERNPVSWEPKLPLLPSVTKNGSAKYQPLPESVAVYRSTTELVDGMFLPPNNAKKLNKLMRKQVKDTAGKNWFDMPPPTITPELKKAMQLLKVGTVIETASDFFTGRLTKKERKATLADELLSDQTLGQYRKRKVREINEQNRPAGVDKWKIRVLPLNYTALYLCKWLSFIWQSLELVLICLTEWLSTQEEMVSSVPCQKVADALNGIQSSIDGNKLGLKPSDKVIDELEGVGQQLALIFNNDGSVLALGGELEITFPIILLFQNVLAALGV
ncbi:hypothetical protein RHMOL_Rhmol10G0229000 [Rhododendron molle]|uniref:Uncharacterized protein n=1 Tax=Rhododendron molle TaxID=49168 RepID=A0ACC0M4W8_RHOML|nr:hypothetical protein RHMOL_Rhmol10G0229000 [Rhododendron molle]